VDVSDSTSTSAVGGGGEVVDGNVTGTIFTMRALDTAVEGCVPVQVGAMERNIPTVYTIMSLSFFNLLCNYLCSIYNL
jgi:hypothetical protein